MKKIITIILFLLLCVPSWAAITTDGDITKDPSGGGGAGDVSADDIWETKGDLAVATGASTAAVLSAAANYSILYTLSTEATGLKYLTPTNSAIVGWNSAGTLGAYTNIQIDDSAAQFYSATASKGTLKVLLSGSTSGKLMTLTSSQTDNRALTLPDATDTLVGKATSDTFTNKTYDVDGTGNVLKMWGYIVLTHPHVCGAGAPIQTTSTTNTYGQCKFSNSLDKATNYAEYYVVVPPDIDTDVDLTAVFKFKLGGADTGDFEYEITFDSVADSAAYVGSLGDAVSLAFTADGSGADGDVETTTETTLTGWRSAMTAGQLMVIRVSRDGDHGNDTSTVDSYSGPLLIKYKQTQ